MTRVSDLRVLEWSFEVCEESVWLRGIVFENEGGGEDKERRIKGGKE